MDGGGEKGVTFNRKRAEGTDGGKRGSMELKTRRLNPVNTTCYVQVRPSLSAWRGFISIDFINQGFI
jgi:hypothetical protein